jgi:hypothetical protein
LRNRNKSKVKRISWKKETKKEAIIDRKDRKKDGRSM